MAIFTQFSTQFSILESRPIKTMTLAFLSLSLFSACYLKSGPETAEESVASETLTAEIPAAERQRFDPENPNQEVLQAYAYLDLLDYTAALKAYVESECQPTACTEEALKLAFEKIAEAHPAARYFISQRGQINAQRIRRGMSAQQWQKTQAALDQYRIRLKAIRSQMATSAEVLALWEELTGDKPMPEEERAYAPSIAGNMHIIQTIVETYGVDWGGVYPPNVWAMRHEAINSSYSYWKSIKNPFTGQDAEDQTLIDYAAYRPGPHFQGRVLYYVSSDHLTYWIYGVDKDGEFTQYQGQALILTNS